MNECTVTLYVGREVGRLIGGGGCQVIGEGRALRSLRGEGDVQGHNLRGGIKIDLGAANTNLCVRPVNRPFNGPGGAVMRRWGKGSGPTWDHQRPG